MRTRGDDPYLKLRGTKSIINGDEGALHRALYKSVGYDDRDLGGPRIGIANSWNTSCPGHFILNHVSAAVERGIYQAGGMPEMFGVTGPCDGIANGNEGMMSILPSREVIANSIELMVEAHQLDGVALVASCDKIVPAMLMAAARLDLPSIVVTGGPMLPGRFKGKHVDINAVEQAVGMLRASRITRQEFKYLEDHAAPGPGSCAMIGTANTMCCIAEVLGMSLPGSATLPAVSGERLRSAKLAGRAVVSLVNRKVGARDIITRKSIENAIRVGMAIGGSTNMVLHMLAIAYEAEVALTVDEFEDLSQETPQIVSLMPASMYTLEDFHYSGGVPAVMKELSSILHFDTLSVGNLSLEEALKTAENKDDRVIQSMAEPILATGGIAVMRGNLAPLTGIARPAAVAEECMCFRGKARVFNKEVELFRALESGEIKNGEVLVVRYEGPKGGPGMREMYKPMEILKGMGMERSTALITDGRFSGSNSGSFVGHISPEAHEGGPLAVVEDGDVITIDIPNRNLQLGLMDEEIEGRLSRWQRPKAKVTGGYLNLYSKLVASASEGAIIKHKEEF